MKQFIGDRISVWQFESLATDISIRHFVSGRWDSDGTPPGPFSLSFSSVPDPERIRANRKKIADFMGIRPAHLFFPSQVHGTRVVHVDETTTLQELQETDSLVTREKGFCVAVLSADCVPILLYDKRNHVVAAVHSGWRGTVKKILYRTLLEMAHHYGSRGENIVAGIGPSVSQENYEIGAEVIAAIDLAFGDGHDLVIPGPEGKGYLDLWKANIIQLLEFGVPRSHIEVSNLCTFGNNDHFFSARKGDKGRFAAGILMV